MYKKTSFCEALQYYLNGSLTVLRAMERIAGNI